MCHTLLSDAGRRKTLGVPVVIDGDNLPSPVGIGLTNPPNIGGPVAPLAPLVLASLQVCRKKFLYITYNTHSPCQSATHYSCFENMSRFVPLKNQVHNKDLKKAGFKKWGNCCSKREEAAWPPLFLDMKKQNKNSECRVTR